jgi:hypothetical protein
MNHEIKQQNLCPKNSAARRFVVQSLTEKAILDPRSSCLVTQRELRYHTVWSMDYRCLYAYLGGVKGHVFVRMRVQHLRLLCF